MILTLRKFKIMDYIIEKNKKERKGRVYFTKETEAAIVKYNNRSEDKEERSNLYQDHIHWPFYKLNSKYNPYL